MGKLKAIITVGVSASGKTRYAEELCRKDKSYINLNRDDLRFSLTGSAGWKDYKFSKKIEQMITKCHSFLIEEAKRDRKNLILSNTNLNAKHREELVGLLESYDYEVEVKDFATTFKEACQRDAHRANGVGYKVINKQWKQWLEYINFKTYEPLEGLPEAVIFDIDGTLADMRGIRGPFEWDKVDQDNCHTIVKEMLHGFHSEGFDIIIVSGRDGICEAKTREWLRNNLRDYDYLLMRPKGNSRPDTEIKSNIFWDTIAPRFNVKAVVDDRPVMNRMWRDMGLKVIDVGDPYDEF